MSVLDENSEFHDKGYVMSLSSVLFDWRFFADLTGNAAILLVVNETGDDCDREYAQIMNNGSQLCRKLTILSYAEFISSESGKERFDIVNFLCDFSHCAAKPKEILRKVCEQSVRYFARQGGLLCLMFGHIYNPLNVIRNLYRQVGYLSPRDVTSSLIKFGYEPVELYGVIPNHKNARYIFPLQTNILRFVIEQHYNKRIPHCIKAVLLNELSLSLLRFLLPSYLVMARWRDVDQ